MREPTSTTRPRLSTSGSIAAAVTLQAPSRLTSIIRRTRSPGGRAGAGRPADAGVVHQHVEPAAEPLDRRGHRAGHRLAVGHVAGQHVVVGRVGPQVEAGHPPAALAQAGAQAPCRTRRWRRSRARAGSRGARSGPRSSSRRARACRRRSPRASSAGRAGPSGAAPPAAAARSRRASRASAAAPSAPPGARRAAATGARRSGTPSRWTASGRRRRGRRPSRWSTRLYAGSSRGSSPTSSSGRKGIATR